MLKMAIAATLATALAFAAVQQTGVTFHPFTRAMAQRGSPVATASFFGLQWRCGDETCFAGYDPVHRVWRTGP